MIIKGDINGDGKITKEDAFLIREAILGKVELTEEELIAADVNGDGIVNSADSASIELHLRGRKIINEVIK